MCYQISEIGFSTRLNVLKDTYWLPSRVLRSTVLIGATTINGILCLAASTAAL